MTPQIKSVWKYLRLGTIAAGGNIATTKGQQEPILTAGARAIASTTLLPNLLSQRRPAAPWPPLQPAL